MADPDYISLRRQIARSEARANELELRLMGGESGASWSALGEALERVQWIHAETGDLELSEVREILAGALRDEAQWRELREVDEHQRRLAETERKRIEASQAYMTAEEIATAAGFFGGLLRRYVRDPADLRAAAAESALFFDQWRDLTRAERLAEQVKERGGEIVEAESGSVIDAEVVEPASPAGPAS